MFLGVLIQVPTILHSARTAGTPLGATPLRLLRIVAGNIFIDSMTGTGGPYLYISVLLVAFIAGLTIMVWGWRSAPLAVRLFFAFAVFVLMASLRDPLLLPGNLPRWEVLADTTAIRYWFLPSLMFLWSAAWCAARGERRWVRIAGLAVLLFTTVGIYRKWTYQPWPESHWDADVARFQTLQTGEHMIFQIYDPGGRNMELIKR
jgi:hypothetical protein